MLSGQYLHVDEDSQLAIRVDVETVGVAEDCAVLSTEVWVLLFWCNWYSFSPDVFTETHQIQDWGGILYKVMHRVAPPPSLTPYPLYISLTEKVAFSHTCLGSLHPFYKPLDLRWEQYYGEISSITRGHVIQKRIIIYSVYVYIVH